MPTKTSYVSASKCFIIILQIIYLASCIDPNDQEPMNKNAEIMRENRALKTDSANEECPMCNSIEMPMELADKINEVSDVDVFIHDFVDMTNSLSNVSSTYSHPGNRKRRAASSQQLRQATCRPIDTLISLVPPEEKDPTIYYFPSCVLVKQCGGCCAHSGTICSPTDQVEKQVTVKKTKFVNDPKLANLGEITVTIKEHNSCKCLCKKTAADCNGSQIFVKNQCRCVCQNKKDEDDCSKNPKKAIRLKLMCLCVSRNQRMRYRNAI